MNKCVKLEQGRMLLRVIAEQLTSCESPWVSPCRCDGF